jgi:hypothetical protein
VLVRCGQPGVDLCVSAFAKARPRQEIRSQRPRRASGAVCPLRPCRGKFTFCPPVNHQPLGKVSSFWARSGPTCS